MEIIILTLFTIINIVILIIGLKLILQTFKTIKILFKKAKKEINNKIFE